MSGRARAGSIERRAVERIALDPAPSRRTRRDTLAVEEPLEIRLAPPGGEVVPVAVTMRTPGADFDLAAGFLFSEAVIDGRDGIAAIRYCIGAAEDGAQRYNVVQVVVAPGVAVDRDRLRRNFYTTSSCGVCGKASIDAVSVPIGALDAGSGVVLAEVLTRLPGRLHEAQRLFASTGGLHAAGLFTLGGELLRVREDVGRHNALDKLVGSTLLEGELPLRDRIIVVSGRLSFELVQKAARSGAVVLAGVSAPSNLAVRLAEDVGLTLVGFLRGRGFNVYAGAERIG